MAPYTIEECKKHVKHDDCWVVIGGQVYDVTKFLDEHPGGGDLLVQVAGRDATSDFEDIGHSNHARELLQKYIIGPFEGGAPEPKTVAKKRTPVVEKKTTFGDILIKILLLLAPVLIVAIGLVLQAQSKKTA